MTRIVVRSLGCVAVVALVLGWCGCHRDGLEHSSFAAQVLGREYVVEIDGKGNFHPSGQVTVVKIGNHQLGIEKERVLLDGKECAKVKATARVFKVVYAKQTLTVKADGATVYSGELVEEAPGAGEKATEVAPEKAAGAEGKK